MGGTKGVRDRLRFAVGGAATDTVISYLRSFLFSRQDPYRIPSHDLTKAKSKVPMESHQSESGKTESVMSRHVERRAAPIQAPIPMRCDAMQMPMPMPMMPRVARWVDGFAIGVVRMLIEFARIRSVCESVRTANPSRRRRSQ